MCRKTWVDQCAVKNLKLSGSDKFMGSLKDIYRGKSGNNVQSNKHAFNHKLFHIYNYAEMKKVLQTCLSRLVDLQSFSSSTKFYMHKSLSFDCSSSP